MLFEESKAGVESNSLVHKRLPDELYFEFPIIILSAESQNISPPTANSQSFVPEELSFTVLYGLAIMRFSELSRTRF